MSQLLTIKQAAEHIGLKPATLDQYRWTGGGPPFFKVGKFVRYDRDDIDTWMRSKRYTSTSQAKADAAP